MEPWDKQEIVIKFIISGMLAAAALPLAGGLARTMTTVFRLFTRFLPLIRVNSLEQFEARLKEEGSRQLIATPFFYQVDWIEYDPAPPHRQCHGFGVSLVGFTRLGRRFSFDEWYSFEKRSLLGVHPAVIEQKKAETLLSVKQTLDGLQKGLSLTCDIRPFKQTGSSCHNFC